jgi:hypothetical protein
MTLPLAALSDASSRNVVVLLHKGPGVMEYKKGHPGRI